ncbi:hypothetical protein S40293_11452 [Stachybotrys chartarum IBT 40293]|nr:hypothetical protein S40293_11452 [Stachybotrys chartarum IBT 40293]
MAFKQLYGQEVNTNNRTDFIPRYQYSTFWGKYGECEPWEHVVDGYGITFDHFVPDDDEDPETLMMNIYDPSDPASAQLAKLDLGPYSTSSTPTVLLIPRCCQLRQGTTDRKGINDQLREAELELGGEPITGTSQ